MRLKLGHFFQDFEDVQDCREENYYRENALGWLEVESVAWSATELPEAVLDPRPSLMMARESGTSFVCQPLSPCSFSIAAWVPASQWPLGSPERYPKRMRALWIWVARSSSMVRWLCGLALEARLPILCEVGPRRACVRATAGQNEPSIRVDNRTI